MTVEVATYISDLNATYPTSTDSKSEGDNHLRLVKAAIKATFPNITGPVTKTQAELNAAAASSSAFKNKIINGNFGINQRIYVSGAATTAGQYTLDRWKVTGTAALTFSTSANKTTVTIPSGQTIQQVIEGINLETATYVLSWGGTAQGRINGGSYGASGAVTASLTGGTNATIEFNTGTVERVQFEVSASATSFEHRPFGAELALCQRYYEKSYEVSVAPGTSSTDGYTRFSYGAAASVVFGVAEFKASKRASPTVATYDLAGNATRMSFHNASTGVITDNFNALASNWAGTNRWGFSANTSTAGAAGTYFVHWTASAEL